jgi:MFS family permease
MYGLIGAAWTLGTLLGAWPFSKVRGDDHRLVTVLLFLLAGLALLVLISAGVPQAIWLVPLYILGGGLNAGVNVLGGVTMGRRVPSAIRGRVAGVFTGVANSANMIGFAIGGALLPIFAPRTLIAGAGAASLLVATVFLVPAMTGALRSKAQAGRAEPVGYRSGMSERVGAVSAARTDDGSL